MIHTHETSKVIVADPSIVGNRGHNLKLSLKFIKSAGKKNIILITSKNFNVDDKLDKKIKIIKFFDTNFYQPTSSKNIFFSLFFFLKFLILIKFKLKIKNDDLIVFPTIDGLIMNLIQKLSITSKLIVLPKFLLYFFYDPETSIPNKKFINFKSFGYYIRHFKLFKKFFFFCDNPELTRKLNKDYKLKFKTLIPQFNFKIKQKKNIISFLGNAREEKGFAIIPEIINYIILKHPDLTKNIFFNIQCTPQIIGYNSKILKVLKELENFRGNKNIKLIKKNLSEEEYENIIAESKIVICPYSNKLYRFRGSYIFFEAISADAIVVNNKNMFIDYLFKNNPTSCENINEYVNVIYKIIKDDSFYEAQKIKQKRFFRIYKKINFENVIDKILKI